MLGNIPVFKFFIQDGKNIIYVFFINMFINRRIRFNQKHMIIKTGMFNYRILI